MTRIRTRIDRVGSLLNLFFIILFLETNRFTKRHQMSGVESWDRHTDGGLKSTEAKFTNSLNGYLTMK